MTLAVIGGLLSAALTFATMPAIMKLLEWRNLVDVPVERSSHTVETLRGGGLAMIVPLIVFFLAFGRAPAPLAVGVAASLLVLGLVGFLDDKQDLGVRIRLLTVAVVGMVSGLVIMGVSWEAALCAFVLVAFVNAFNFMDGINGISSATMIIAGVAYGFMGLSLDSRPVAGIGFAIAGVAAGFMPFNFPTAKVFLGDAGSYFAGGAIAIAAAMAWSDGASLIVAFSPLALYAIDTAFTLISRILRGERWHEPHREHVYQRVAATTSHTASTLMVAVFTAVIVGTAAFADSSGLFEVATAIILLGIGGIYLQAPGFVGRFLNG